MIQLRTITGLVAMLCAIAALAAPAMGWFEGTGKTPGKNVLFSVTSVAFTIPTGGSVNCKFAEGRYEVWSKATSKVNGELVQPFVNPGPHLLVAITKWSNCILKSGAIEEASTISACNLQLVQLNKLETKATVDWGSECVLKHATSGCIIKVPQIAANEGLKAAALNNEGSSLVAKLALGGVTIEANAACGLIGVSKTTSGIFKAIITAESVTVV